MNERRQTYWNAKISKRFMKNAAKTKLELIPQNDYWSTLPKKLREKIQKIIPYEYDEFDRDAFVYKSETVFKDLIEIEKTESEKSVEQQEKTLEKEQEVELNESECSDIIRLENEYPKYDLIVDLPVRRKKGPKERNNWISDYASKQRIDRIIWESKIYNLTELLDQEKNLEDQAEVLMDACAERFAEWFNSIYDNEQSNISKERVISLFNIEGDRTVLAAMHTEPKEVRAIAKTVADKWNLPEMAIELKYEKYLLDRLKNRPKKFPKIAFGKNIPAKDLPWKPVFPSDFKIGTIFPKDLLSYEKVFKGIGHLRTTGLFIDFLLQNPTMEKPSYLVKKDAFHIKEQVKRVKNHIPLYDLLKLDY